MSDNSLDPHLNLFRRFGSPPGTSEYENNVTHALINTLRLSDPRVTRSILTELVPEVATVQIDWTDIAWGLQRPPRSPEAFQNRFVLAISVSGQLSHQYQNETLQEATAQLNLRDEDAEPALPEEQKKGIPDAWIYTKTSDNFCALIEIKTRGGLVLEQIKRHETTHFGMRGATMRNTDVKWRDLSQAADRAYRRHPSAVGAELLSFLSAEGLAATFRFDDATVHLARERLPTDVMEDLAARLRLRLNLDSDHLKMWPEYRPLVAIFRSFEAVGNVEVWLKGDPPNVRVQTLISLGTATPRHSRLSMPAQIDKILQNIVTEDVKTRFFEVIAAIGVPLTWTVLDRPVRAQYIDFDFRESSEIADMLRFAGHDVPQVLSECFGENHPLPGNQLDKVALGLRRLHRAGPITGGNYTGFNMFARAYLGYLDVPAYGRTPQDVLPLVVEHCVFWHRLLRVLSGLN